MAKVNVYNMEGEITGEVDLAEQIFGIEPNLAVLQQAVVAQLANRRQGTAKTKLRGEVRGGGRKPYRQKGTGRARQGSIRAAQWVGGGVIFGPEPRCYRQRLNKKMRRLALKSALSLKQSNGQILVMDSLEMDEIKTRRFVKMMDKLGVNGTALIITEGGQANLERSARNVPGVRTGRVNTLNVHDIMKHERFVMTRAALEQIQEVYA
ncbi:MAG: 50S ribosomal protein L4 [Bacillota bacterium]|nr:50S ribosomal protein L4 [Bacillota bacterium]